MSTVDLDRFALTGTMSLLGGLQLATFARRVGLARMKHKVKPPEVTGDPEFVRTFRAQQNSLEFFPISMTVLWVSSAYCHPVPSALVYMGYLVGRHRYFEGYIRSTEDRKPGFFMSSNCLKIMLGMSAAGLTVSLVRYYGNVDLAAIAKDAVSSLWSK